MGQFVCLLPPTTIVPVIKHQATRRWKPDLEHRIKLERKRFHSKAFCNHSSLDPFHVFFPVVFFVLPIEERKIFFLIIVKLTKKGLLLSFEMEYMRQKNPYQSNTWPLRFLLHHKKILQHIKSPQKVYLRRYNSNTHKHRLHFQWFKKKKREKKILVVWHQLLLFTPWCCYTIFVSLLSQVNIV